MQTFYVVADCYGYELYEGNHTELDAALEAELIEHADYNWKPVVVTLMDDAMNEIETQVATQPKPPEGWLERENTTVVLCEQQVSYDFDAEQARFDDLYIDGCFVKHKSIELEMETEDRICRGPIVK